MWPRARIPPAFALLLWCALGRGARAAGARPLGRAIRTRFSPIFWYLLNAYDTHGNLVLAAIAVLAFVLRRAPAALGAVRFAGEHPWRIAAVALPLFCIGALTVYRGYPLSMDEYVPAFQAGAFAAGKLGGQFPTDLLDQLLPRFPQNYFFLASRVTGEVSGSTGRLRAVVGLHCWHSWRRTPHQRPTCRAAPPHADSPARARRPAGGGADAARCLCRFAVSLYRARALLCSGCTRCRCGRR